MKRIVIGGIAALIATVSMATTADAGNRWRHHGWHGGHHHGGHYRHGWRHGGWRAGVWIGGPRVVIGGGCVVKKRVNRHGVVVKKRFC